MKRKNLFKRIVSSVLAVSLSVGLCLSNYTPTVYAKVNNPEDYVKNWPINDTYTKYMAIFENESQGLYLDSGEDVWGFSDAYIPTPADGDMSIEYVANYLNNNRKICIQGKPPYASSYSFRLEKKSDDSEEYEKIAKYSGNAGSICIPAEQWTVNSITSSGVSATSSFDSTKFGSKMKIDATSEVYFEDGSTYLTHTFNIPFKDPAPSSISVSQTQYTIEKGTVVSLNASIQPTNACSHILNYSSSNANVATIDNSGNITAVAPGTATITIYEKNFSNVSATVQVTVESSEVESISIDESNLTLKQDDFYYLRRSTYPKNAKTILSWSSNNNNVITVDSSGYVIAKNPGTATVTVTTDNGKSAYCNITIIATKAESISLDKNSIELNKGDSSHLTYTIKPTGVDSNVSWTSNNTNIATVDSNGNVYAKSAGTATITVTTDNGKSDSCKVTVKNPVTSIKLNKHSTTIAVGKTEKLSYTITPSDADNKSVKWSSSDTSAVTVDSNGTIKGIKANSSATITVTSANNVSDSITVTVEAVKPTSISFSEPNKTMYVGDTLTLKPTILPTEAASDKLAWSTTNSYVVSVSGGVLTAKKEGTAKITVRTTSDKIATCQITVKAVEPTSVSINNTKATIKIGDTITLTSTVSPKNASQNVTWSNSNTNIATVSNGIVTAKAVGSATITVKTSNGKTATCNVTVTPIEVTSIALNKTSATLKVGENTSLSVTYTPSNATTKSATWTSDNNSIATVSNGVVTAKSVGSAVITAKTSNGKTATCKVTVNPIDVTSISLNETEKTIEQGKTATIYATVSPSNATVKTIKWSSSNTSVATIDTNGKITAKSAGSTIITATSNNGKTATCKIIVPEVAVTSISLSKTSASINIGDTVALTATINPENAANKSIIWAVDDKSIATVDNNGNVKAVGVGKTIVTAKTSNGKTAACTITVIDTSNLKVNFTERMQYVELGSSYQLKFDALPEGTVVKFESSNEDAVTVDNNGIVTAHQMKQVIVAATIGNNESVVYVQVTSNREIREAARKQFAEEILYYVNIERKKAGVAPLELMDDLSYLAQIRTNEQVQEYKNNKAKYRTEPFISHTRPNGTPWSTVFEYASIKKKAAAENLIQGAGFTAETCVNRWMNSPGHRANILRANLTHMGIGVEFTNINPDGGSTSFCVTQLFIEKR